MRLRPAVYLVSMLGSIALSHPVGAAEDLTRLSLEELMNIKITSVAKKPQRVSQSAAAVHVITQDDIRRSSATSVPELLRNVPGLNVARIDSNKWAISSRGFNGLYSNKLLVLIDGRSVYTPIFSGVFWDVQDTFIDDIERIEVVRGPGGSLWGANAVNGVINIITKKASDTDGALLRATAGTEERLNLAGRYGQAIDDHSNLRLFAKHVKRDSGALASGDDGSDATNIQRGGFRYDNALKSGGNFMFQGEAYAGRMGHLVAFPTLTAPFTSTLSDDTRVNGQFLLGRWENDNQLSIQTYFDRAVRHDIHAATETNTLDVEIQKRRQIWQTHDVVVGAGYRFTLDSTGTTDQVFITPGDEAYHLASAFVNDEITLSDSVKLILGSKLEYNSFTGIEIQPSARTLWNVAPNNTLWASVSRAVRTPSRAADGVVINSTVVAGTPPVQARIFGSKDVESEELVAFELGFKTRPLPNVSVDIAAFYNIYDKLLTTEAGTAFVEAAPAPVHAVLPLTFANNMSGEAHGLELSADWRTRKWLRLRGAYTLFELFLHRRPGTGTVSNEAAEKRDPRHQFSLMAEISFPQNVELDVSFRAVDRLSERDVRGYVSADARIGWSPIKNVELSIAGRNLLEDRRREFKPEFLSTQVTEVERSVYGSVKIKF
jgi:iron complex outermembrane recepter protein